MEGDAAQRGQRPAHHDDAAKEDDDGIDPELKAPQGGAPQVQPQHAAGGAEDEGTLMMVMMRYVWNPTPQVGRYGTLHPKTP